MSETKEATYKSLLQRMVHMTEQRDFDEDLMKEVYGALLPPRKFEAANEKVSRLTAERDDLSRKLAVAESERDAWRAKHGGASGHVDTLHRLRELDAARIADLERQLADIYAAPPPPSGPADEGWMERAWAAYEAGPGSKITWPRRHFINCLKQFAPATRYPEVVEFLDAAGIAWSMGTGGCEGKVSYYVQAVNIENGAWFARDTLAAACRAALDSRKERSDG